MKLVAISSMMVVASAAAVVLAQPAEPAAPAEPTAAPPDPTPAPAPEPAPTAAAAPSAAPVAPAPAPVYYPPPGYYPPPPPPPPPPKPSRIVSITFSPIHLLFPVFEAMLEVRPTDHLGIAAIGGFGEVTAETSLGESAKFSVYEVGGQVVGYPLEAFHSLQLGAELLYVHVSSDELNDSTTTGVAFGYAVGPLVGYKLMTEGGFTFVVQGGIQYFHAEAQAQDSSGNSGEADDRHVLPLLNLNLGWSF